MKSKELIRQLQELDPTGETEVCLGNDDIHIVDKMPAYYDGSLKLLIRDPNLKPCWDIIGVKEVRDGSKIVLSGLTLHDIVWEDENDNYIYEGGERFLRYIEELKKKRKDSTPNG